MVMMADLKKGPSMSVLTTSLLSCSPRVLLRLLFAKNRPKNGSWGEGGVRGRAHFNMVGSEVRFCDDPDVKIIKRSVNKTQEDKPIPGTPLPNKSFYSKSEQNTSTDMCSKIWTA